MTRWNCLIKWSQSNISHKGHNEWKWKKVLAFCLILLAWKSLNSTELLVICKISSLRSVLRIILAWGRCKKKSNWWESWRKCDKDIYDCNKNVQLQNTEKEVDKSDVAPHFILQIHWKKCNIILTQFSKWHVVYAKLNDSTGYPFPTVEQTATDWSRLWGGLTGNFKMESELSELESVGIRKCQNWK